MAGYPAAARPDAATGPGPGTSGSVIGIDDRVTDMPSWTKKDQRRYEHVKEREVERGRSEDRAEAIAGKTVNKQRRREGRTPNRRTSGTGNPTSHLDSRTKDELYNRARELGIKGRSSMRKSELVEAIRDA